MRLISLLVLFLIPVLADAQSCYLVYLKPKVISDSKLSISRESMERKRRFQIEIDEKDYAIEDTRVVKIQSISPVLNSSRWLNAVSVLCTAKDIDRIKDLSFVDHIELLHSPISIKKTTSQKLESNYTKEQYGQTFNQIKLHNGHTLHDAGYEGQGMKIAVFDAGFDRVDKIESFKHLFLDNRIFPIKNIVENSSNLYTLDGHGTAVLGCMASYFPDSIVASAPKAFYYLFITEDPRSETRIEEFNWAVAAEMADSMGIDIINSSLGYHQFDDPSQNYSREDMNGKTTIVSKAASIAVSKGIVVVNSAGNHGNKDWQIITAPADVADVISVGALDNEASLADFSSRGYYKLNQIKPNIVGVGKGTTLYYDLGSYFYGSGTSFSSPLLAGLIACFWQKNKELSPTELRTVLYSLSSNYLSPNNDIGFGIPKFELPINKKVIEIKNRILSVYPNPSSGNTILEISAAEAFENAEIEIYFSHKAIMKNKVKLQKGVNHVFLNTDNYAKGIYFFKVKMGNYILEERYLKY
jgi:hypothetical protein